MAAAFKVRLEDGVEVGPLDAEMLRSWWQQGMVTAASQVRQVRPIVTKRWVRVSEAFDTADWGPVGGAGGRAAAPDDEWEDGADDADRPQRWRTYVGSALLLLIACAAAYLAVFPGRVRPAFQGAPWREIALGHTALALLLVRGWEPARKAVRVLVCLLTFSLFPLAAPIIVNGFGKGIETPALVALFSAWVMGSGLFFFLAGRPMPWKSVAFCLLWIALGAAAAGYFALAPAPIVAAL
jgi:hypothetical protein